MKENKSIAAFEKQTTSSIEVNRSDNIISVKVSYISIRLDPPSDKKAALNVIKCLKGENSLLVLAEVIPNPGFSYYYKLDELEKLVNLHHRVSIKTEHLSRKFNDTEPIYQYLFSLEDNSQLLYLMETFDQGEELTLFIINTSQNVTRVAELIKNKFQISYFGSDPSVDDILIDVFNRCDYVIFFNFDGDLLCIESTKLALIEKVRECL